MKAISLHDGIFLFKNFISESYINNLIKIAESYDIKIHKGYIEFGLLSLLNKLIEEEGKKISFDYKIDADCIMHPNKFILK